MQIDFIKELRKRDKLNQLFDLCRKFVPKSPESFCGELRLKYPGIRCKGEYTSRSGNYITVWAFPNRQNCVDVSLISKTIDSPKQKGLDALVDIDKEVMFLFCTSGTIMRTAEGEIVEAIDWIDCDLYIPKLIPELSQNTRKAFEEVYDIFYADNVRALELPTEDPVNQLIEAIRPAIKELEREEQKSKFTLIKPNTRLSDGEER